MKYFTLIAVLLISFNVNAEESEYLTPTEQCTMLYELAETIMKARQAEMPMPRLMSIFSDDPLGQQLVMIAYKRSAYSTERMQQNQIDEFANQVALKCYQDLSE